MTITEHIKNNERELKDPLLSPQRRRHLNSELDELNAYRENHPNSEKDPTPLELFCNLNPDASECRIYNV
jgi:hypothetical protein